MSKAIAIYLHSVRMVISNLPAALRISLPWIFLFLLAVAVGSFLLGFLAVGMPGLAPLMSFVVVIALVVLVIAIGSIVAIGWHRFVLLGEMPKGPFGDWRVLKYKAYSLHVLKIALVTLLISLLIGLAGRLLGVILASAKVDNVALLVSISFAMLFVQGTIIGYFSTRLAIGLPAIALGKNGGTLTENLQLSKGFQKEIFFVVMFSSLLATGWQVYLMTMQHGAMITQGEISVDWVFVLLSIVVGWIFSMVGISLLTTFYGHYVEERPI